MRALIFAFVCALALAASAQAAPRAPDLLNQFAYLPNQEWVPLSDELPRIAPVDAPPTIEMVAGGCGWGWHRRHWQDRSGYWHWGRCVPDNAPYVGWRTGQYYSYPYWHGAYPAWGWGYQ